VLPIITKYNITSIDIDTRNELLEFYGELKRYNITLPDQDVYLISRKCGLDSEIAKISKMLQKQIKIVDGNITFRKKAFGERVNQFINNYHFYVSKFKNIDTNPARLLVMIMNNEVESLYKINYNDPDIVFEFIELFNELVVEQKATSCNALFNLTISNNISINMLGSIGSPFSLVGGLQRTGFNTVAPNASNVNQMNPMFQNIQPQPQWPYAQPMMGIQWPIKK